jgi:hypothetical protein
MAEVSYISERVGYFASEASKILNQFSNMGDYPV